MALPTKVTRGALIDPVEGFHREFDTWVNRMFGVEPAGNVRWAPYAVDVREDADHIYVDAELPGFKKDEIEITLQNGTISIAAEHREDKNEERKGEYLLKERRYNRFLRSFTLPPTVDEKVVDAKLTEGILHVVLNKREESKPRKITVA